MPKLVEAFRSLVPFLILSLFRGKGDTSELIMAAVGVLGGFGAVTLYLTTRYGIEGEHIVWRSGWLFKKDRRIPLANIQNVNIRQGVLERLLKVVIVEVETAAGTSSELKLQVVDQAEADRLRA
ncbi:MAG TPA: PH domain-containing protein, partial [Fimbriimonadaceae bacterium]|nr:PH domain-containing protein [Fimbriimonadaceae bacterium]